VRSKSVAVCFFFAFLSFLIPNANARQSNPLQIGYVKLLSDSASTSPAAVAILGWHNNGVLISETTLPSSATIESGRIFAEFEGPANTAVAMANPTNEEAVITFFFTDASGNDFGAGSLSLLPHHQFAAYLTDAIFGLSAELCGTFTFSSSIPIAVLALNTRFNERSELLMSTIPISPLGDGIASGTLLFPRFNTSSRSSVEVIMMNPSDMALSGTARFFGMRTNSQNAFPIDVVVGDIQKSAFTYAIPPRTVYRMRANPVSTDVEIASVSVAPDASNAMPANMALVSRKINGVTTTLSSVAATPPGTALRMYLEEGGNFGDIGSLQTVVEISNPSIYPLTVQLEVKAFDGTPTGLSSSIDISPEAVISKYTSELFPSLPPSFKGVLQIRGVLPVIATGLRGRYNERGELLTSTIPAYDDALMPATEVYFPHIVNGGGYTTQLVLLSTGPAQDGSMWLLSQQGLPLDGVNLSSNP
jgi:hypothetical protein